LESGWHALSWHVLSWRALSWRALSGCGAACRACALQTAHLDAINVTQHRCDELVAQHLPFKRLQLLI
jgi:hypothetical protein